MEQLSFASVYRTAAILAAFSHASAAGEDQRNCAPWPHEAEEPISELAWLRAAHAFLNNCRQHLCRRRIPRTARIIGAEPTIHGKDWEPRSYANAWGPMGPHRPSVTSHFAFADEAPRSGPFI